MVNDDEIVVARDEVTGKDWTLGHVRRDPTSEAWLLLNDTLSQDKLNSIYFRSFQQHATLLWHN